MKEKKYVTEKKRHKISNKNSKKSHKRITLGNRPLGSTEHTYSYLH